jgi:Uri superfamily endonuclease
MGSQTRPMKHHAPATGGLYLLLLDLESDSNLKIGKLGEIIFEPGSYAYIGSAGGPGGLATRLAHHLRPPQQKRKHWHIDYLLPYSRLWGVAWSIGNSHSECEWAAALEAIGERYPYSFGASDCRCAGHLVKFTDPDPVHHMKNLIPARLHIRQFNAEQPSV